jgi:ribosomal protein S6--L-glutamate ligase
MKLAILSRNEGLYSTSRLAAAAGKRGHEVRVIDHQGCYVKIDADSASVHFGEESLAGYDAVIPRIGTSCTVHGTIVVQQFESAGAFVLNSATGIVQSRDKLRSLQLLSQAGVPVPNTIYARSGLSTADLIEQAGGVPVIIKLLKGTQGHGVILAEAWKAAESTIDAFRNLRTRFLVQEYIAEANASDVRCLVVGGAVVAAMVRQGIDGEYRSNLHRGGMATITKLTQAETEIATRAADAVGLAVAGVDILRSDRGPVVLEINSSPGLEGIEKITGLDIAGKIIEYVEQQLGIQTGSSVGLSASSGAGL